jgi:spermidine synthase
MDVSDVGTGNQRAKVAQAVLLCFFASGFSGLVYQVIWVRELVLVFGATTFAVSTVLTAFMGGLALGSFYFGRRSETIKHPLKLYALLEIGIGIYGLAVPFIFAAMPSIYQPIWRFLQLSFFFLSIVRFLFAALILILPTALMGATLPILSSYYARERKRIGLHVGTLYTLNTFGAVLGSAATGFLLIPALGMRVTTFIAAAINITLGFVALRFSKLYEANEDSYIHNSMPEEVESQAVEKPKPEPRKKRRNPKWATAALFAPQFSATAMIVVLASFALSGFIALCYEVIWSRILALIIGSSVYAFSIMLATFLIGLALGAAIISRFVDRIKNHVVAFALIEIGVGLSSFAGAYFFNELPFAFVRLHHSFESSSIGILLLARFVIAASVMIVPTLLLGGLFPLVVKIVSSNVQSTGRLVGNAYSANTVGSIVGSFVSGFVMIPSLGLLGSLKVCIALNFAIAIALFLIKRRSPYAEHHALPRFSLTQLASAAACMLLMAVVAFADLPWNSDIMSSAVYRYAPSMNKFSRNDFLDYVKKGQGETIFYKEGITATVAVQQVNKDRVLKVNGKPEASTTGDMPTQVLIGALPLLVREKSDEVLLIGLGSGVTLGSIEQFPIKRVTCVELEPAVVEASQQFNDVNNRPLEDPRLRMISNDGRNFIFTTGEKFDVIVSEPSNPWLTGIANLFTLEYFKRGADRLTDDGVFCQWLQIYEMHPEDVKTLVATFKAAFPNVFLFRGAEGDLMLLGSKSERKLNLPAINSHFDDPRVAAELRRINTTSITDLMSRFYFGNEEVGKFSAGAKINTDDNALIEFSAPRRVGSAEETVEKNVKELIAHAASPLKYTEGKTADTDPKFLVEAALGAVKRDDRARAEQLAGYALEYGETAEAHGVLGELRLARGDDNGALDEWRAALALDPKHFYSLVNLGKFYLMKQDFPRSVPYLDRALQTDPTSARAHHLRGLVYQAANDNTKAVMEYRKALPDAKYTRNIPTFYLNFGTSLMSLGLYEEAAQLLEEFTKLAPGDAEGHFQLGAAYEILSERSLDEVMTQKAVTSLKRALTINAKHPMSHYYLSKAYRRLELFDLADAEFELYERFLPQ